MNNLIQYAGDDIRSDRRKLNFYIVTIKNILFKGLHKEKWHIDIVNQLNIKIIFQNKTKSIIKASN